MFPPLLNKHRREAWFRYKFREKDLGETWPWLLQTVGQTPDDAFNEMVRQESNADNSGPREMRTIEEVDCSVANKLGNVHLLYTIYKKNYADEIWQKSNLLDNK